MQFVTKEIVLRDGRRALLRSPDASDAPALLDYLLQTAQETPFLLREPEECTMTVEAEEAFVASVNASDGKVMILCEVEGVLAGNCQLSMNGKRKTRHRGSVAIALKKEFWGLGIGTALFEEMIAIARSRQLLQLELEFVEGNVRARALYEKMGFRITGYVPNAIRQRDGTLLHNYMMVKEL